MKFQKKYISKEEALSKLQRYCAYQDRCHQEVRTKLIDLGIYGDDLENIIAELIAENFLNEERFARSFARGKFRIRKWGRIKIRRELKLRKISDYCQRKGMSEIDEAEYLDTLNKQVLKKWTALRESDTFLKKQKVAKYLNQRGFELNLVWDAIKSLDLEQ